MGKKKVIYIDMDGVLADFESELYSAYPELLNIPRGTPESKEMVDFICQNKYRDIFNNLKPMKGAIDAYNYLCNHYDVYILSTPMWGLPESYQHKREWVERYLGDNAYQKLILSHNKGLVKGDYLIDDRLKHGVEDFEGEHVHFGQDGFNDWEAVLSYLKSKDNL